MNCCEVVPVRWKGRSAVRLSNRSIEIVVLLGGGHIADFRPCGAQQNTLFESPWETIEPQEFSPQLHASRYGDGPVGRLLSGYTGHALALGYFGMPGEGEAANGLPLHGEAVAAEWHVIESCADDRRASLVLQVVLPAYRLRVRRGLYLSAGAASVKVEEHVTNMGEQRLDFQWVQHAAFGEPLLAAGDSRLFVSVKQGRTWPLGYERRELLVSDCDFQWPLAPAIHGGLSDLSLPFQHDGTGFLASLLCESNRPNGFIAAHNRRLNLVAGYVFDCRRFPWIALWEENRARDYPPWNGITRARGVEFGTSPMPLGLDHALRMRMLFDTPVFATLEAGASTSTAYHLFTATVPNEWSMIEDVVEVSGTTLVLRGSGGDVLEVPASCAG